MDLALDQMVGSMRRQDAAAATRANEYRRIALERRALDGASRGDARSPWAWLMRALAPRRARRGHGNAGATANVTAFAQPGRP